MSPEFVPYYAVIFTSLHTNEEVDSYAEMADKMESLAKIQKGYLGFESARNQIGVSISYWKSLEDIKAWKQQSDHLLAQEKGRQKWYKSYKVRICKVEREYSFEQF